MTPFPEKSSILVVLEDGLTNRELLGGRSALHWNPGRMPALTTVNIEVDVMACLYCYGGRF